MRSTDTPTTLLSRFVAPTLLFLLVFGLHAGVAVGQASDPAVLSAVEDGYALRADSSIRIEGRGVLANDEFAGADSVVAVLVSPPAFGTLDFAPTGAFTYRPDPGFSGEDVFTYHIQTVPRQEIAIDPTRSNLDLFGRVSTPIGSDTDEVTAPVGGSLGFFLEPNLPPYAAIHLQKMDVSLAEAIDLEFRFGGLIALGRLFVAADSGGIRLVINDPGPSAGILDSLFTQEANKVGVIGNVQLEGTGLLATQVPDDPQVFDTETDLDIAGRVYLDMGDTLRVALPVLVQDTVDISGTDIELSLEGLVVAGGALRVPALSNVATVSLTVDPRTTTGLDDGLPAVYALAQNYPNPFNPATRIAFSLAHPEHTRLVVYDLLGREVATLVDGFRAAGPHEVTFDAGHLPSGMYVYRLTTAGYSAVRTLVLMK